jgi:hypothetical protein
MAAEDYIDCCDPPDDDWLQQEQTYWIDRSGKKWYPFEMSDSHIANTIALIERRGDQDMLIYQLLRNEQRLRVLERKLDREVQ